MEEISVELSSISCKTGTGRRGGRTPHRTLSVPGANGGAAEGASIPAALCRSRHSLTTQVTLPRRPKHRDGENNGGREKESGRENAPG